MKPENQVTKRTQRPARHCCFYRRFVCFDIILFYDMNDSLVYQSAKAVDIYSLLNFRPFSNASSALTLTL